jgi:hypothetical protein
LRIYTVEGVVAADPTVENLFFWVIFRDNVMEDEYEEFLSYAEAVGNGDLGNVDFHLNFLCCIRKVFVRFRIRQPGGQELVILPDPDPNLTYFFPT